MSAIDPEKLNKAMDGQGVTAAHLADATGKSLVYIRDIISGRRNLKRNPELRKALAAAIGVPRHWIERQDSASEFEQDERSTSEIVAETGPVKARLPAAIDPENLNKAMDGQGVTAAHLADATGKSLVYIRDIISGRRDLKRNPELRKALAAAIGVPRHWIERQDSGVEFEQDERRSMSEIVAEITALAHLAEELHRGKVDTR